MTVFANRLPVGAALTPMQLRVLTAYVRTGSQKATAHDCGIAIPTVKNHLGALYVRLGVSGVIEALNALGWIALPGYGPTICGWVAYCSRPNGHRGHHGGMRAFVAAGQHQEASA